MNDRLLGVRVVEHEDLRGRHVLRALPPDILLLDLPHPLELTPSNETTRATAIGPPCQVGGPTHNGDRAGAK